MKRENGLNLLIRATTILLIILICNRFIQLVYITESSSVAAVVEDSSSLPCGDAGGADTDLDQRRPLPNKIPLIIHQAYPHPDIPFPQSKLRDTWLDHHFEWEFMLWDEQDLDDLIRFEYPWAYDMYSSSTNFDQKVDIAKYFILLTHGGVFADINLMSVRNGIRIHKMGGLLLPLVNISHPTRSYQVSNAWMASERDHPFLLFMAQVLVDEFNEGVSFGGSISLYNAVRDFEAQRLPTDPPIHYLESGYVIIPDSNNPSYPRECRDNSKRFNLDICSEKLLSVDAYALSYRTTFDLKQ